MKATAETKYRTILCDPPWRFRNWSMGEAAKRGEKWAKRNGRSPYDTMDTREIERLPVEWVAARDCTLLLWATAPKLNDAMRVIDAWGFEYKSAVVWAKMTAAAAPRCGLGYHARSATEFLLIGGKGNAPAPEVEDRPLSLIFCPIGAHSAKPDFQYELAENYPGPYLELFHRPRDGMFGPRPGWCFLGNEVPGCGDIRDDLRDLARREVA